MRVGDWSQQLADAIERWRETPREFGRTDCCQFVGDVVLAITGTDFRDQFPAYTDQAGAMAILEAYGGMVAMLTTIWGDPEHVSRARIGDVVVHDGPEGMSCGICTGVYTATMAEKGLTFWPTLDGVAAWSI